ncbi:hypothetical protein IAT40_004932 [Kwoniella sp. CBS 6097]
MNEQSPHDKSASSSLKSSALGTLKRRHTDSEPSSPDDSGSDSPSDADYESESDHSVQGTPLIIDEEMLDCRRSLVDRVKGIIVNAMTSQNSLVSGAKTNVTGASRNTILSQAEFDIEKMTELIYHETVTAVASTLMGKALPRLLARQGLSIPAWSNRLGLTSESPSAISRPHSGVPAAECQGAESHPQIMDPDSQQGTDSAKDVGNNPAFRELVERNFKEQIARMSISPRTRMISHPDASSVGGTVRTSSPTSNSTENNDLRGTSKWERPLVHRASAVTGHRSRQANSDFERGTSLAPGSSVTRTSSKRRKIDNQTARSDAMDTRGTGPETEPRPTVPGSMTTRE